MYSRRWTSELSSDVVEDRAGEDTVDNMGVSDIRVPTVGLHNLPIPPTDSQKNLGLGGTSNFRNVACMDDSNSKHDYGRCDSFIDSGVNCSFQSICYPPDEESANSIQEEIQNLQKLSLGDEVPDTTTERKSRTENSETKDRLLSWGADEGYEELLEDRHKTQQHDIPEWFQQDEDGDTKLHLAIIQLLPDFAIQIAQLAPAPKFLDLQNHLQQTPLHLAVITKQPEIVRFLVLLGASVDLRDRNGNTALHHACKEGSEDCVVQLTKPITDEEVQDIQILSQGNWSRIPQDLDIRNYDGYTCLHLAARVNQLRIAHYLVHQCGANVNAQDGKSGRTILHYAVESSNSNMVTFLLKFPGLSLEAVTFDGSTALQLAFGRSYANIVNILLQSGANRNSCRFLEDSDSSATESEEEQMDSITYDDIKIGGQPVSFL